MHTQMVIEGLKTGANALTILGEHTSNYLNQMADMGASKQYEKLRAGHIRIVELKVSLTNLYTLLELHGSSALWDPQSKGKAVPRG